MCNIFALKSSNLDYAVRFINTFYHFINSNTAKFYDWMPFLRKTQCQYGDWDQYFYWGTISRWLPTKVEEWSTCLWDGDCTPPGIKLVFQEVSWAKKNQLGNLMLSWPWSYLHKTLIIKVFFLFDFAWLESLIIKQKLKTKFVTILILQ